MELTDGIRLSAWQFLTQSVIATVCMFLLEKPEPAAIRAAVPAILYAGIMSSGVAYTLQIVGQKDLNPTIASLAMCLESVFSAISGWIVLGETADVRRHRALADPCSGGKAEERTQCACAAYGTGDGRAFAYRAGVVKQKGRVCAEAA